MGKLTPKIQQQGQIPGYKTNTKEKKITHTQQTITQHMTPHSCNRESAPTHPQI